MLNPEHLPRQARDKHRPKPFFKKRVAFWLQALLCLEIGGGNGMELLYWSLLSGIPALDAAAGKAFPEVQLGTPALVCDEKGNRITIDAASSLQSVDDLARAAVSHQQPTGGLCAMPCCILQNRIIFAKTGSGQAWFLRCHVATYDASIVNR
jgi:DUF917 family protein